MLEKELFDPLIVCKQKTDDPIYQPLRLGRILHKVNF